LLGGDPATTIEFVMEESAAGFNLTKQASAAQMISWLQTEPGLRM
jgi:hypothetical protein